MTDPNKAVFLSYAREDADAARRIADALRAFGVEVWFDQAELRGGDSWDAKIKKQIRECALFMPVVSARTQVRHEGYFRREWKLAVERTHDMAAGVAFIVPIIIDDTPESEAAVPDEFMRVQWTRLPHGVPSPQFVEQVKHLLGSPRKAAAAARPLGGPRSREAEGNVRPSAAAELGPPGGNRIRSWMWSAAAALVIAGGAYFALRPTPRETIATALPVSSPPAAQPPTDFAAAKSIAVLAFANLSEDTANEYFSDGISEELLNVLAKVPGLKVSARTSAFSFKGKGVAIPEIARQLGVAYVVEGSVRKVGNRVRITAQLIKAADGFHVWSENFDRELKDIFAVQDEIAGLIAKNLSLKIGATGTATARPVNPEAFQLYLQSRVAWNITDEGNRQAERLLQQALILEPDFARAHAALSDVWRYRGQGDGTAGTFAQRDGLVLNRMVASARRAIALDPELAEAHEALGAAYWMGWKLDEAERELRMAVALSPNYALGRQVLGRVLMSEGKVEEGLAELRRAVELDPLSTRTADNCSLGFRAAGRMDEALGYVDRALALDPANEQALAIKASILMALGRREEAAALAEKLRHSTDRAGNAALVFAQLGRRTEAEEILTRLTSIRVGRSATYAVLGRYDDCIRALETDLRAHGLEYFLYDPAFDPIRQDPRFVKLLRDHNIKEAHDRAQAWLASNRGTGDSRQGTGDRKQTADGRGPASATAELRRGEQRTDKNGLPSVGSMKEGKSK